MQYARRSALTVCIATAAWLLLGSAAPSLAWGEEVQFMTADCNDCGPGYTAHPWGPGGTLYWDDGCTSLGNCNYEPILPLRARCRIDVNDYYTAPVWYFAAEAAPLFRDAAEDIRLTSGALHDTGAFISTNSLDTEYAAGMRFTIGRTIAPRYRVEFAYLGSYAWNDVHAAATSTIEIPDPMMPAETVETDEAFSLDFESTFHNGEVNIRHRLLLPPARYEASFLCGVRYMQINERLGFVGSFATVDNDPDPPALAGIGTNTLSAVTNNDLIGFQIGLQGQFLAWEEDNLWIDAEAKGGIAHNTAARNSVINGIVTAHEQDATAFFGDVSVMANYRVLSWLTVRAGYQATFISGLALADRNIATNPALIVPPDVNHSGELILHGLVGGLSGAW